MAQDDKTGEAGTSTASNHGVRHSERIIERRSQGVSPRDIVFVSLRVTGYVVLVLAGLFVLGLAVYLVAS